MSIPVGQAARQGAHEAASGAGRWLRTALHLLLALVIVAAVIIAGTVIRLSQGPLEITWLARQATQRLGPIGGASLSLRRAELAWEGLHGGTDRPLDLTLQDATLTDPAGATVASVKRASVALVSGELLHARLALSTIDVSGAHLRLRRAQDGATTLDLDTPPSSSSHSVGPELWSRLQRVQIHDTTVEIVDDRQLGAAWSIPSLDVDLDRAADGGARGTATLTVALGPETLRLDTKLAQSAAGETSVDLVLAPTNPAHLAALAPPLAPLTAFDAPLALSATATFDPALKWRTATMKATAGAGTIHAGEGTTPIRAIAISAQATPDKLDVSLDQIRLQAREEAQPTTFTGALHATKAAGKIDAKLTLNVDQMAFMDLGALWPAGTGGPGTRPWLTKNVTAGTAHDGHVEVVLAAPEDLSDVTVSSLGGSIEGSDVTTHWLRPVPPIEHGEAHVVFVDPDTMDVLISSGRQQDTRLTLRPSKVHMTGLAGRNQFIAIQADIAGPFSDMVTLLHHPKIKILDRRPIPMKDPSGQVNGVLTVNFPLKNDLSFDNVALHAIGKLANGHAGGIAVGRDIDRAALDYDVNNDGLKITGTADLSGIPSQLKVDMDFKNGPPSQVMEQIAVTTTVTPKQLAAVGLNTEGMLVGSIAIQLTYLDRRDTTGDVLLAADLRQAGVLGGRIDWKKAAGEAGKLDAHVLLKAGKLVTIERLHGEAPGLSIDASADAAGGRPNLVQIRRFVIGQTTDVTGEIQFPARDGDAYIARIAGRSLDVSPEFDRKTPPKAEGTPDSKTPPFKVDAKLGRVLLAGGRQLTNVTASVDNDGTITRTARLSATAGTGPVAITLTPVKGGRKLAAEAQDAGALLRTVDVIQTMSGGRLLVTGEYDDTDPAHPLRGTADITDFRIRNAPSIGRILQGMSLYGLVELARGPGLGFTRLVAPFQLRREVLTLGDARAYSASLGLTAKGQIDLAHNTAEIEGTVIPAYFFNSLLGRVPLLGRLFSPEKEGGLFAATYSVHGKLDDPKVGVNPLAALTPGFLRGFFDIFDSSPTKSALPTVGEGQR